LNENEEAKRSFEKKKKIDNIGRGRKIFFEIIAYALPSCFTCERKYFHKALLYWVTTECYSNAIFPVAPDST
jgi:hypothetical protein